MAHCNSKHCADTLYRAGACNCPCVFCIQASTGARASLLTPHELPKLEDGELTFTGMLRGATTLVCNASRPFRGQRLTVYGPTRGVEIVQLAIGRTAALIPDARLPAKMFRPNSLIYHRGGLVPACEQTLDLPTVKVGETVSLDVQGPVGRPFLAQIHGQSLAS